jgi:hypothetical protein
MAFGVRATVESPQGWLFSVLHGNTQTDLTLQSFSRLEKLL